MWEGRGRIERENKPGFPVERLSTLLLKFLSLVEAPGWKLILRKEGKEGTRKEGRRGLDGNRRERKRRERREGGIKKNRPDFLVARPGALLPSFPSSVGADFRTDIRCIHPTLDEPLLPAHAHGSGAD